jgi:hypothetical protein
MEPEPEPAAATLSGVQLLAEDAAAAEGAEDLQAFVRIQEAGAAAVAAEVGGVQVLRASVGQGGDDESDEEDEASGASAGDDADAAHLEAAALSPEERALTERLVARGRRPPGLGLSDEQRVHCAADCRGAATRAFTAADAGLAQQTMAAVSSALGLSAQEAAFFSDVGADDPSVEVWASWAAGYTVPPAHLAPAPRFGVVCTLVGVLSSEGRYDARQRTFLRRLAETYAIHWAKVQS